MKFNCDKVYCKKCRFLSDEQYIPRSTPLKFKNLDLPIIHGTPICIHNIRTKKEYKETPLGKEKRRYFFVDNPLILNVNNKCPHYRPTFFTKLLNFIRRKS